MTEAELRELLSSYDRYSEATIDFVVPLDERIGVRKYVYYDLDEPWLRYLARAVIEHTPAGPRCVDLRLVARPGGPPVTSEGLRHVPLGRVVREVEQHLLYLFHRRDAEGLPEQIRQAIGDGPAWGHAPPGSEQARRDRDAYRRALARRRAEGRRWRLDAGTLGKVAAVYRDALASGRYPTAAVQQHFGLATRGQAAKWVQRARQEGQLGSAPRRRMKGERTAL